MPDSPWATRLEPTIGLREVAARVVVRVLLRPVEIRLAQCISLALLTWAQQGSSVSGVHTEFT